MAINLIKHIVNNKVYVRIIGDTEREVIQEFWKYINNGKSVFVRPGLEIEDDTGLNWITDFDIKISNYDAYFAANLNEFVKTLQDMELYKLSERYDNQNIQTPPEVTEKAKKNGIKNFNKIPDGKVIRKIVGDNEYETIYR